MHIINLESPDSKACTQKSLCAKLTRVCRTEYPGLLSTAPEAAGQRLPGSGGNRPEGWLLVGCSQASPGSGSIAGFQFFALMLYILKGSPQEVRWATPLYRALSSPGR